MSITVDKREASTKNRLRRVIGQLQGVERMLDGDKDCVEVLHQLLAARSAIGKIATTILAKESCKLDDRRHSKKLEQLLNHLIQLQ